MRWKQVSGELLDGLSERVRNCHFKLGCLAQLNGRELLFRGLGSFRQGPFQDRRKLSCLILLDTQIILSECFELRFNGGQLEPFQVISLAQGALLMHDCASRGEEPLAAWGR
jgi:hypothetical protein